MEKEKKGRTKTARKRAARRLDVNADPMKILQSDDAEPKRLAPAEAPRAFNIGARRSMKISEMILFDPAEPGRAVDTGIRIGVRSVYSDEVKEAATRAAEGKDIAIDEARGRVVGNDRDIDENIFEQTIAAVAYWRNVGETDPRFQNALNLNGVPFECTEANVRQLFTDPDTRWIQQAVERHYLNFRNFFAGPKSESESPRMSASE